MWESGLSGQHVLSHVEEACPSGNVTVTTLPQAMGVELVIALIFLRAELVTQKLVQVSVCRERNISIMLSLCFFQHINSFCSLFKYIQSHCIKVVITNRLF